MARGSLDDNKNIMYTCEEEKATNFGNISVDEFVKMKSFLEEKEDCKFDIEFVRY